MFALIRRSDNTLDSFVESTEGYDLEAFDAVEFEGSHEEMTWSGSAVVVRPRTTDEQARAATRGHALWERLESATPEQIESWLGANVSNLAEARQVLKFILLALKSMRRNL